MLVRENQGGWMGLYNTFFWVDRTAGTTAALYTQTQPFADPAILDLAETRRRVLRVNQDRRGGRLARLVRDRLRLAPRQQQRHAAAPE